MIRSAAAAALRAAPAFMDGRDKPGHDGPILGFVWFVDGAKRP